jgi:hypothetical protein
MILCSIQDFSATVRQNNWYNMDDVKMQGLKLSWRNGDINTWCDEDGIPLEYNSFGCPILEIADCDIRAQDFTNPQHWRRLN